MLFGPLPDALDPGFHCVRTHWIRDFMAFHLARHPRTVRLARQFERGPYRVDMST
jgi:hypothetical protein